MSLTLEENCFQFKMSFLPCMVLQINYYDLKAIEQQIILSILKAPKLFLGPPVLIDLEKLHSAEVLQFTKLKQLLATHGMSCIGVRNGSQPQHEAAIAEGLSVFPSKSNLPDKGPSKTILDAANASPPKFSKCITVPVRSGVQIYAKETDLVVMAAVSPGAELFADGNIHIYGPMRGRALAGVQGKKDARIFCHITNAELLSIAGYYLTKEDIQVYKELNGMTQIYLDNTQIRIEAI